LQAEDVGEVAADRAPANVGVEGADLLDGERRLAAQQSNAGRVSVSGSRRRRAILEKAHTHGRSFVVQRMRGVRV